MCKPKIKCWCGQTVPHERLHYPFGDPNNGPAHLPKPPCPDCGQEPHPGPCFPTCTCQKPNIYYLDLWLCASCGLEVDDLTAAHYMATDYACRAY